MPEPSEAIIERMREREVTGILSSRETLDAVIDDLFLAGFDRADIDVSGGIDELQQRVGMTEIPAPELADLPQAPRRAFIWPEDIGFTVGLVSSLVGFGAAVAAAGSVVLSGGEPGNAIGWGLGAGIVAGGITALAVWRYLKRKQEAELLAQMATGGFILWVRVKSPGEETQAQDILLRHGAKAVHVHEIELEKRPEDIPLSSLRPDPWLDDERLGRP
jgi:hypothetical protein